MALKQLIFAIAKHAIWGVLFFRFGRASVPLRIRRGIAKGVTLTLDVRSEGSYWLGTYDNWIFDRVYLDRIVCPGDVAWDCGAFVGYYTAIFRTLVGETGKVETFEASNRNHRKLLRAPLLNGWSNVRVTHTAVGPDHTKIEFAGNLGGASGPFWSGNRFSQAQIELESVESCGIDELAYERGFAVPDFVKFDLETAEVFALKNGKRLFTEKRPLIFLELHGSAAFDAAGEFLEIYQYLAVAVDRLPKIDSVSFDEWQAAIAKSGAKNLKELSAIGYIPHMLLCIPTDRVLTLGRR